MSRLGRSVFVVVALAIAGLVPMASSATPASDGNPNLPPGCGVNATLVLDRSGSINSTEADQVRAAAQLFADALVGTPSTLKVVTFATRATGINSGGTSTSNLGNIVFRDPSQYSAPFAGAGNGGTNWDDGLETARRSSGGPGELVVFITDGDPTYRNEDEPDGHANDGNHALDGNGSDVSADNVSAAEDEADLIKTAGAHMFGIGVGLTDAASEGRLSTVTGDEELTLDGGGNPNIPFGEADYTIAPNFNSLEAIVAAFVRDLCAPSVNVTKYLQKADGTTAPATGATPWTFSATVSPTPSAWSSPAGANGATANQATDAGGGASFKWDMAQGQASVDLSEAAQPGWVYNGARCERNALDGTDPVEIFDTVGTNAPNQAGDLADLQGLTIGTDEAVNCDVYNRQIRTATIQVQKAIVPSNLPHEFDFTLSQGQTDLDTVADLGHGETGTFDPVAPGTYTVAEAPVPGFTQTSAVCDLLSTQATETVSASQLGVAEGQAWRCTFTNTAQPGSIKVVKNTVGADGTFPFTANVPDLGNFQLATNGGTASTATVAVPVGTYSIAEQTPAAWQLTGATCTGQQSPGSVDVGPGQAVVCTFTNTAPAPSIQVTKTAGAASVAEPGGPVTYTVNIINTSVEPLEISEITDSIEGGPDLDLTVVAGPITATDCDDLIGDTLTATGPGASTSCQFTATVSGNGGDTIDDEVTVTALDGDDNEATDSDDASVAVTNVKPTLTVSKTPSVASIAEPGGNVTYTVKVTNTGAESVTLDSLTDSIEGGPAFSITSVSPPVTATTCAAGGSIAPGADATCSFTIAHVVDKSDFPDGDLDDTVVVTGHDDDDTVSANASAEVAITDAKPTITVTKTAAPTSVAETGPGQSHPVTFTVSIQNTSPETVTIDSITDSVEGGPAAPVGGTCAAKAGTSLSAGASTTCEFTMPVSGDAGDTVDDVVEAKASDDDGNQVADTDDASVAITDLQSSIAVTKTADVGSVPEPGGDVTYTVEITNTSVADGIVLGSIVDSVEGAPPVPAGGTCAAKIGTSLAPGASTSCTFTMPVSGQAGDVVDDTVTVTGTDDDGAPVSDTGDESVAITDVPSSITVAKTASPTSVAEPGGDVTFTVDITNTSAADSVTLGAITDSVEGGAPFAAGGSCPALIGTTLAPGGTAQCSFVLAVEGKPGDSVLDTVVVSGTDDDDDPVTANDSAIVDVTDVPSSIVVTKTPSVPSVPEPGANVTYTVGIENQSATDTVILDSITDSVDGGPPVAAGGTCPALIGDELAPGASTSCQFTMMVSGNAGDVVPDTVVVKGYDDDQIVSTNGLVQAQASAVVDVTNVPPAGTVSKTADPALVGEPGGSVEFDVLVTNTSPSESVTVTAISDLVDGSAVDVTQVGGIVIATDCATGAVLAPGGTYACSFTLLLSGANAGDVLVDQITVTLTDDEGDTVEPSDTETVSVTDVLPTIEVVKDGGGTFPAPGQDVPFDVTVTNTSPNEPVTITELTDSIEGGAPFDITTTAGPVVATDCATGSVLAPGGTYECTFSVSVTSDEAGTEADTVDAVAVDDEGNEATDGDGALTTITAVADLAIDKRLSSESLPAGGSGSYELEVTNDGPSTAAGVVVVDTLPEGLTPTGASGDGWACAIDGQTVTCERPSLAPGASATVTLTVDVAESLAGTTVTNVGDVSAETEDPDDTNNRDEEPADVPDVIDVTQPTVPPTQPGVVTYPNAVDQPPASGALPRTGSDVGGLTILGLCLVAGGALVVFSRRLRAQG